MCRRSSIFFFSSRSLHTRYWRDWSSDVCSSDLTALMRRQLTELHDQAREPVAALWASESSIYGRFGYAPATWRGNLSGDVARLALRPDVDLGEGRGEQVGVQGYPAAAAGPYHRGPPALPGNLARAPPWGEPPPRREAPARQGAP